MFYPHELCVFFRPFIPRAEQLDLAILGPPGGLCPAAGRSCGLQRPIRTAGGQLVGAGDHGKLSQGGPADLVLPCFAHRHLKNSLGYSFRYPRNGQGSKSSFRGTVYPSLTHVLFGGGVGTCMSRTMSKNNITLSLPENAYYEYQ